MMRDNLLPECKSNYQEKATMKTLYNKLFHQLLYISHPAGGFFSLTDFKKRKRKKNNDLPNNLTPDSYNVRGNSGRKNDVNQAGAP
jgi:hypothetical protein